MKDMLDILLLGLVGKELTFLELDNQLMEFGLPTEFDFINDWEEIADSGVVMYQTNENCDNCYGIYFDVVSMNTDDEPSHNILVRITGIELKQYVL